MTFKLRILAAPIAVVGLALAAIGLSGHAPKTAYALTNCTVTDLTFDSEEVIFAGLINDYRVANSLPKLTVSVNLNREASWHAKDMADKNYFSHTDSLKRSPEARGKDCETKTGIGENIAAGTSRDTAQEAFDAWKASAGHNNNMLHASYKQIGIARYYNASSTYKWYWVTDFSLNTDGTNMLSASNPPAATATATRTPTRAPASPTATRTPTRVPATATPTRTPTPTAQGARMSSPAPGSSLTGTSSAFRWSRVSSASQYRLDVGTTVGGSQIRSSTTTSTSMTVSSLPRGKVPVYVRLWTRIGSTWSYVDYTYTSAQ